MSELQIYSDQDKELMEWLETADLSVAGEENLQPGDIGMPPRLRISQPNRPIEVGGGEAEPGKIVNTLTGEVVDELYIVPVVFLPRTRVLWPAEFATTNDPECASDDGVMPAESGDARPLTSPHPGPCAKCSMAQFGEDSTPPRCKGQRNFLVMVLSDEGEPEPAILTMQSTALTPAKHLTTLAKTQRLVKSVRFVTTRVKDERGSWFVPAFGKGRKLEPQEILALVEARDELRNLIITADVAEEMRENGGGTDQSDDATYDDGETIPF